MSDALRPCGFCAIGARFGCPGTETRGTESHRCQGDGYGRGYDAAYQPDCLSGVVDYPILASVGEILASFFPGIEKRGHGVEARGDEADVVL